MRIIDKKMEAGAPAPARQTSVVLPGESLILNRQFVELEFVLFRPLHPMCIAVASISGLPSKLDQEPTDTDQTGGCGGASPHSHRVVVTSPRGSVAKEPTTTRARKGSKRRKSSPAEIPTPAAVAAASTPSHALNSSGFRPPLFFDTTACLLLDTLSRSDYVATGRPATDIKGLFHKPHAVVSGTESATANSFCNYNINIVGNSIDDQGMEADTMLDEHAENLMSMGWGQSEVTLDTVSLSNGPVVMAAGDGVIINFRRISTCSGVLISTALFSNDVSLNSEHNIYYMVRKPKSVHPICLVPVSMRDLRCHGSIVMMVRRVKVRGEMAWELSNVSEPLLQKDVKGVVLALQQRGLRNPAGYRRRSSVVVGEGPSIEDLSTTSSPSSSFSSSASSSSSSASSGGGNTIADGEDTDVESPARAASTTTKRGTSGAGESRHHCKHSFDDLLAGVEQVVREGRRQYNVGRSHVHQVCGESASSDEDEVLDDALRAVVPKYGSSTVVRYEDGTYNVGSRPRVMVSHYVDQRETYALDDASRPKAMSPSKLVAFHPHSVVRAHRMVSDESMALVHQRPEPPLELLPDDVIAARLGSTTLSNRRGSSNVWSRRRSSERRRRVSRRRSTRRANNGSRSSTKGGSRSRSFRGSWSQSQSQSQSRSPQRATWNTKTPECTPKRKSSRKKRSKKSSSSKRSDSK